MPDVAGAFQEHSGPSPSECFGFACFRGLLARALGEAARKTLIQQLDSAQARRLLPLFFVVEIDVLDPVLVKEVIEARFQVLPTTALFGPAVASGCGAAKGAGAPKKTPGFEALLGGLVKGRGGGGGGHRFATGGE